MDLYEKIGDRKNWLKSVRLARAFAVKTKNNLRISELDYALAYDFIESKNYDSALFYADNGLSIYLKNNFTEGLSKGYRLKGTIYSSMKNYLKAVENYQLAIDNLTNPESKELADAYHSFGAVLLKTGSLKKGNEYLLKALELREEMGDLNSLSASYEKLAESRRLQGDYKGAYEYHIKYKQIEDSVFSETKVKLIEEMQTQYETEKKDQLIAGLENERKIQQLMNERKTSQVYFSLAGIVILSLLAFVFYNRSRLKHQSNLLLTSKNKEIERQNKEREMLLKEIHHRVKNNLQIISSLLSMQSRKLTDNKMIDAMNESQSRVKTMALIHEKLYQYDNLSQINMKEYMAELSGFLNQTYRTDKNIEIITEVENINLDIDTAVPLGLITNELLSNALKYAFADRDSGIIKIVLKSNGVGDYELHVSDTGKGLDDAISIEKTTTLGLRLVRTLSRQINGNLKIESDAGTTFSLTFSETRLVA